MDKNKIFSLPRNLIFFSHAFKVFLEIPSAKNVNLKEDSET